MKNIFIKLIAVLFLGYFTTVILVALLASILDEHSLHIILANDSALNVYAAVVGAGSAIAFLPSPAQVYAKLMKNHC